MTEYAQTSMTILALDPRLMRRAAPTSTSVGVDIPTPPSPAGVSPAPSPVRAESSAVDQQNQTASPTTGGSCVDSPGSSTAQNSAANELMQDGVAGAAVQRPQTLLQRGITRTKRCMDGTVRLCMTASTEEPQNLQDALADPSWKKAMGNKFEALVRNKTWHLIPACQGTNVIDCK